ncbi:MAG: NUDIX domain-containing protein [Patescibacteria group bacterium]|nr:NUDIX domain-containing protein [Patescibacteria group bacterium]MDE1944368.1 NUDIX domain-containing protein [Patescibacteria group bacterium]MDE1944971.1 NUDIX domain-containing protein [Patescibacteria group bacterium]MDE2057394.1 NUDIX domain-containing protein [Patescibacteria group bacterium]
MTAQLPVALHVFLVKGDQMLLLKRKNTGTYDGQWSVPAGRLDAGESATSGAV